MISEPEKYAESFINAGADHITFHIETVENPADFIKKLHSMGVTAGITLNPETPVESITETAPLCDMVLVMTVHPGFGGQKFIPKAAEKIRDIRRICGESVRIEVDGGINPDTAPQAIEYGADTLVAGSAVFAQDDRKAAIEAILASAN